MIYSTDTLRLKWGIQGNSLYKRITYQIQTKKLFRIMKGIFSDIPLEDLTETDLQHIAVMVAKPAYISYETILATHGIISQYSDMWHLATSRHARNISIPSINMHLRLEYLPEDIFFDQIGMVNQGNITLASPERALADTLYRSPHFTLETISRLNHELLLRIASLWQEKAPHVSQRIYTLIAG